MNQIKIYNSKSKTIETEKVFGDGLIKFLYQNPLGKILSPLLTHSKILSHFYGHLKSQSSSAKKIPDFCKQYDINLSDFEEATYKSFNDFFIRKFKPSARSFETSLKALPAFCEARYTFYETSHQDLQLFVKGALLNPLKLLGEEQGRPFVGGPLCVARLAPVDYHRFHFPDDGEIIHSYRITGNLNSVNPLASFHRKEIFCQNERQVSLLRTKNFGDLAYIEVGALCVGKIVQTHSGGSYKRGQEKGYFLFGGSTVILLGTPGAWKWKEEFLKQNQNGIEVLVPLGNSLTENAN